MGDMVREQVTLAGLPITPENLGKMAELLRRQSGQDVVAQLTAEKVAEIAGNGDIIIIDGLRSMQEVEFFRDKWQFPVVAVHSSPSTRHARLRNRNRSDDSPEPGYYEYRDTRELKFGIAEVIAMADEMIVNTSITSEQELQDQVNAAIDRLLQEAEL